MINCQTEIKGDVLTITIDLSKTNGLSKSGKSKTIASTGGNVQLGHKSGAKLGLNVYQPA